MAEHDPSLHARCTECGGNVPIVLAGPPIRCEYCGAEEPLAPEVGQRVAAVRQRIATRSAREQQLVGKQARLGRTYDTGFLIIIATVWLLVAAMLYLMIDTPPGMSLSQLLFDVHLPSDRADDARAKWWIVFILANGFALTMLLYGGSLILVRRVVRHALPRAPLVPGGAPRCRCCAADLPPAGTVRRCASCSADHLVLGERYQREERSLAAALAKIEQTADRSLALRQRRVDRVVRTATLLPMGLAIAAPVALALGPTRPDLWFVPAALLGAAAVVFGLAAALGVPAVRTLHEARPGDELLLAGATHRVSTKLGYMVRGTYIPIVLLAPPGADAGQITHAMTLDLGDEEQIGLFAVRAAGEPLAAGDAEPALELSTPDRRTEDGPFADRALRVWAHFARRGRTNHAALDADTVRLWCGTDPRAADRPAPTFTLHAPQQVRPDEALLLTATDLDRRPGGAKPAAR